MTMMTNARVKMIWMTADDSNHFEVRFEYTGMIKSKCRAGPGESINQKSFRECFLHWPGRNLIFSSAIDL